MQITIKQANALISAVEVRIEWIDTDDSAPQEELPELETVLKQLQNIRLVFQARSDEE
jgi:hypothetical protein